MFWARVLLESALGALGTNLLQALASSVVAMANRVRLGTSEGLTSTIGGKIHTTQINTQRPAVWLSLIWHFAALCDVQVIDTCSPDQIGSANFPSRVYQHC